MAESMNDVLEAEIDQWMKEYDHYIAVMCMHSALVTFVTGYLMVEDIK